MPQKESIPLGPPSKKESSSSSGNLITKTTMMTGDREDRVSGSGGKGEGESTRGGGQREARDRGKGGKRAHPCSALVVCSKCGEMQNIIFRFPDPPEFQRCVSCGELMLTDSYRLLGYGWPPLCGAMELRGMSRGARGK